MTSVVIAAQNEAGVIGACLDALLGDARPGELDVTVVANGCTDDTAAVASQRPGVRVIDRHEPGKAGALNAGDRAALGFPRIYLDADMVVGTDVVRTLAEAVERPRDPNGDVLAAFPDRRLDLVGRPWPVRCYFAINTRLPLFREGLFGRGMIAVSKVGRDRFVEFPEMVADDLFLDAVFAHHEKLLVSEVSTSVAAPRRTSDLVNRLVRVRRGNSAMRRAAGRGVVPRSVRPAERWSWLTDVVLPKPWLAPAGAVYVALSLHAARRARRTPAATGWERDESTRPIPQVSPPQVPPTQSSRGAA